MIVFLDIDGVLATNRTYKDWRVLGCPKDKPPLDHELVKTTNEILIEAGAQLILSSSWRFDHNYGVGGTIEQLQKAGLTAPFIGCTPLGTCRYDPHRLNMPCPRGYEIYQSIEDRGLDIKQIIILDDDPTAGMSPPGKPPIGGRWIRTPEATGMGPKHFRNLRKMLGLPQS